MPYLLLVLLLAVVAGLSVASYRTGRSSRGCCAPADPHHDLRMWDALHSQRERR